MTRPATSHGARPAGLSTLGALRQMRRDPIGLLERAATAGDVVRLTMPRFPVYLVNHPELVWDVLVTGHHDFMKGPTMQAAKRLLGEGLLTSEDELHRRQRRLIQPMFHHERIVGYATAMTELADVAASRWPAGRIIDIHAEMAGLTLAIVGRTLFGADVDEERVRTVRAALAEILAQFNRVFSPFLPLTERLPLPSTRRFNRARSVFDHTIGSMIDLRRGEGAQGDDLLSLLLGASEDGRSMDDRQVRDEAITLFLAGHETTGNALTWTWYLLSRHPEVERRVHEEVDRVLGTRPPTPADLPSLPVIDRVIAESMRLYPPAWAIGRRAIARHDLGGVLVDRESVLIVSPWLLHHDPRWWRDPQRFDPDRFAPEHSSRPRHAYIPFGGGPRMCIGDGFARMEAALLVASIARRWRFELDPTQRVALQPVVTLRPRYGMRMRAIPRS
jgi:cytochrome P450